MILLFYILEDCNLNFFTLSHIHKTLGNVHIFNHIKFVGYGHERCFHLLASFSVSLISFFSVIPFRSFISLVSLFPRYFPAENLTEY